MKRRLLVVAAIAGSCALLSVGASRMTVGKSVPQTPAEMWLSWSPEAKGTFVDGYLHGFDEGKSVACYFHGEKMEAFVHGSMPVEKLPENVCRRSLPEFVGKDHYLVYVDAITNYYTKYPNDRQAGISRILLESATPPGLTVDQIHEKLTR